MRLHELLNRDDVRLKPVAKLDSIIESLILLGQAHTSDAIICANLQAGFYLEPGSQTEREVCQLLSVNAERKNVSFSTPGHGTVLTEPDVSPMAIPSQSSTAGQVPNMSISTGPQAAHAVPPSAATSVAPSSTSPGPTFSANRSAPVHKKKFIATPSNTYYHGSGSVNISVPPRGDDINPKPGDVFTHCNTTAPAGQQIQAWLCREIGTWTEITDAFNTNAKIEYPVDSKRVLVQKWEQGKLDINWLVLSWLERNRWGSWLTPNWAPARARTTV
ncbi:hypothetical protein GGX14DRAFT_408312 [Mycena pura]|uniref:Uncharacterized protein n=1 Tax=Mycena pura TaxID=153505 RepID=A0AAD6Y3I4_9AGAR|nr:hypothetical protein GGX14DRAFT_408312 [Mycena pura]